MRPIAGIVAISLLVANSAIPGRTICAAGSAGWQAAEQASQILRAHEGPVESVDGVFYRTYVTTCSTKSPECVGIAVSLTGASRNIALEERRAEVARIEADRNGYDLAQRAVALHQNALNNLALELEACEARCPPDPHGGAMIRPPRGGPLYRYYFTVCPSRFACLLTAEDLSSVSRELSALEERRREALALLTVLRNSLDPDRELRKAQTREKLRDLDNEILPVQRQFQSLMDALEACEAECPRDSSVGIPVTGRGTLGLKIAVGTLAVGGVAAVLTRGGDSDPGTPPPTPNPPTPTPNPPTAPAFDPTGNYQVTNTFSGGNPADLPFVALAPNGLLILARNSPVRITSSNVTNWVPVSGEYDDATNRFNLTGNGTVAGIANVSVRFEGSITTAGQMTGSYTMGAGGELPGGQPLVYAVTGQKQ